MFTSKFDYLYVEPSTHCALSCPRCPRTYDKANYELANLSLDLFEWVLNSKKFNSLKTIEYGGNYGDPIFHPNLEKLINISRKIYPNATQLIHTSGNRKPEWWRATVQHLNQKDMVLFSIDGLRDSNHIYRVNSKWSWIDKAMRICTERTTVVWKFIVFKHNEHQIMDAIRLAQSMGVAHFELVKSHLFNGEWQENGSDSMAPDSSWIHQSQGSFGASVAPRCQTQSMHYLSAQGLYSPCCWIDQGKEYSVPLTEYLNRGLSFDDALQSETINELVQRWSTNPYKTCLQKCSKVESTDKRSSHARLTIDLSESMDDIDKRVDNFKSNSPA